jgi:hypothetical protein
MPQIAVVGEVQVFDADAQCRLAELRVALENNILEEFPRAPAVTMTRALKRTDAPHVAEILVDVFTQQKGTKQLPAAIGYPAAHHKLMGSGIDGRKTNLSE